MASIGNRLAGRRIVITGGASGIGLAAARLFIEQGANVAILDLNEEAAEEVARDLGCFGAAADVTDADAVGSAIAHAAAAMGGIDGLVNNAGVFVGGRLGDADLAGWNLTLAVNLTGPFIVASAVLPYLKEAESGGTIVNVGSGIALRPGPGSGAYAAAKAGLLAWTKVLAQELGPHIRVNAMCPGPTDTPLMRANSQGLSMKQLGEGRALERGGEPIEQAHALLYLTGNESTYVTGVVLPVDGGRAYH